MANVECAIMCAAMAGNQQHGVKALEELFAAEPDRLSSLSFEVANIYFDWSKTHLDQKSIGEFIARAERMGFKIGRAHV